MSAWRAGAIVAIAWALGAGCSSATGPSDPTPRLQMDLVAVPKTGSRNAPISVIGQVSNTGSREVNHRNPCATEGFEWSATFGESTLVYLEPPGGPSPCPEARAVLGPGMVAEGGVLFGGTLYTAFGDPYDAPPGDYVVRAAWKYWTRVTGADSTRLRASILIHWESVSAEVGQP